jgi:hypothetical protein
MAIAFFSARVWQVCEERKDADRDRGEQNGGRGIAA